MHRKLILSAAAVLALTPVDVSAADRAETVTPARMAVRADCIIAPTAATSAERAADAKESAFGLALGTIGAKFVGDLAGAGLNALGEAVGAASAEHGFVAAGQSHYSFYEVRLPKDARKLADLQQRPACLILFVPSANGSVAEAKNAPELSALDTVGRPAGLGLQLMNPNSKSEDALKAIGLATLPALYIEAETWSTPDGMVVRPVLLWYREALKGAPSKAADAELHFVFATPSNATGATAIGAPFALAEIRLPALAPGTALGPWGLAGHDVVGLPGRPTTGSPDTVLASINARYTALSTADAELVQANGSLAAAERALSQANTSANGDAVYSATQVVKAKTAAREKAQAGLSGLKAVGAGTTNVQARFVVIRDANKFGQAIATALKARSADLNTAVTTALTPKGPEPDWATTDTAYLQAATNVAAKQREIDVAAAAGDAVVLARLNDELLVLKARANEAAVSASRQLPYPGLLASLP